MKVEFTPGFIEIYVKRYSNNPVFQKTFDKRTAMFSRNPANPALRDHKLLGRLEGFRTFSVNKDIRVVYSVSSGIAYFVDIGTHEQVYS